MATTASYLAFVLEQLSLEESRFDKTLKQGNHEFEKIVSRLSGTEIDGESAFHLYDTYGFPVEMTLELARENGLTVDMAGYEACFKKHQENSHAGADAVFKGGLLGFETLAALLEMRLPLLQRGVDQWPGAQELAAQFEAAQLLAGQQLDHGFLPHGRVDLRTVAIHRSKGFVPLGLEVDAGIRQIAAEDGKQVILHLA